jgi:5-guanidino-2-oxopentanoate decarboxylase
MPAAIGAKVARPDRAVLALAGDGGFLFTVQELGTAVELGLPLPIVIWNNDAFGQIAQNMREFGIEETAVRPRNPDFQALARAYGMNAVKTESLEDITSAIKAALAADGPTLIEVHENATFLD